MKRLIFFLIILLMIPVVSAGSTTSLGGSTDYTMTFPTVKTAQNLTYNLTLPIGAVVTSAVFSIQGVKRYTGGTIQSSTWLRPSDSHCNDRDDYDPAGITTDNNYIWLLCDDNGDGQVWKYTMSGTYQSNFNTDTGGCNNGYQEGITTDSSNIWVVDEDNDVACKFSMAGGYLNYFSTLAGPEGIGTAGSYLYVTNLDATWVYKYTKAGSYQSRFSITGGDNRGAGLTTDGRYIWIINDKDELVRKYSMAGSLLTSWNTFDEFNEQAISQDGTYFYEAYDDGSNYNYIGRYWMDNYPQEPYIEIGNTDGNTEWSYTTYREYEGSGAISDFTTEANDAINLGACDCIDCSTSDSNCNIPVIFHSEDIAKFRYYSVNVQYWSSTVTPDDFTDTITGGESTVFNITISHDDASAHNYTFTTDINSTSLNITYSPNVSEVAVSATGQIQVNITSLQAGETAQHLGNITVKRESDSGVVKVIDLDVTVSPSTGNIEYVDNTAWTATLLTTGSETHNWTVNNTGVGNLTSCYPHFTGELASKAWITFAPTLFTLNSGNSQQVNVTIFEPVAGIYTDRLNVNCSTGSGEDEVAYADRPIVTLSASAPGEPVPGGGGGGGGISNCGPLVDIETTNMDLNLAFRSGSITIKNENSISITPIIQIKTPVDANDCSTAVGILAGEKIVSKAITTPILTGESEVVEIVLHNESAISTNETCYYDVEIISARCEAIVVHGSIESFDFGFFSSLMAEYYRGNLGGITPEDISIKYWHILSLILLFIILLAIAATRVTRGGVKSRSKSISGY